MSRANLFKVVGIVAVACLASGRYGYSQDTLEIEAPLEENALDAEATRPALAEKTAPDPASIDEKWIEALDRLGGDSFADRKRAGEELIAGGACAIPALDFGLDQDDAEVRDRCIDLLRKATKSAELDVREAARLALLRKSIPIVPKQPDVFDLQAQMLQLQRQAALQRLQAQAQAQRAQQIVPGAPRIGNRVFPPPGLPGAPGFRPQGGLVPPPGAFQGSMTIRETNGVREIELVQNGTKITAKQLADGSISGEITKSVDGKSTTEKFTAKNVDELATKAPEAAERLTKALKTLDEAKPRP